VRYADRVVRPARDSTERSNWLRFAERAARIGFEPTPLNVILLSAFVVSLLVLIGMTAVLADGRIYGWEVDLTREFQRVDYPQWAFDLTANRLTNSDTPIGAAIILSVVALLWLLRLRIEAGLLLLLSVPLHVAANFPKLLVERERPSDVIDGISGFGGIKSFPSGHAEFAITFYGFLLYVAIIHIENRLARAGLVAAGVGMALAVGFARIEVGKHWPLDIVGGYVIGVGILAALIWAQRTLRRAAQTVD
jgi:undecaprenyl-diphosphatase